MDDLTPLKTHQPCPDCGSSDALTLNTNGTTKCYSCGDFTSTNDPVVGEVEDNFVKGKIMPLPKRGIHEETCKKYNYRIGEVNGQTVHIANYCDLNKKVVAQKYRYADKTFKCNGSPTHFFGQHLFPNGGKRLVITEGEIDCLTVSQVQNNTWEVVSLSSGVQSAKSLFKRQLEWLNKFEEIVLMFDSDEVGKQGMEDVAHIIPAGKCKIANLPMKDANELLLAEQPKEILKAIWNAKVWGLDAIVGGDELYERLTSPKNFESIPYPFEGLNKVTRGIRTGEIITFCAGSGIGKSQICKEVAYNILTTTDKKIGYIALEESVERTGNGIIGLHLNKLLHLDNFDDNEEYRAAYEATVGNGRFFLYDHWGSIEGDKLVGHIRYMAKSLDVEYIVLDHISIVISGSSEGDERRMIDNLMTKLRALVEECKIGVILVSHLKRPEGRGHEDGATTSVAQLRGSAGIAQLSDMVIGLERNQQDVESKHLTSVRVLKNRFSGDTGVACNLRWQVETGRLTEEKFIEGETGENYF
tara:strand:- start:1213 stop:2796 length:1584 start_codon:yes stop_codon:yes gene_type:complete